MVDGLRTRLGGEGLTAVEVEAYVERFAAMGTRIELHVFGVEREVAREALMAARHAIEAVDDALTIHRPSPTTALNEAMMGGREAVIDDANLLDALVAIDTAHALTEGLFDPTADRRFAGAKWRVLELDRRASGASALAHVRASQPMALDFGGFGKGFALDRACTALRSAGVVSACLSAGESSIAVIGEHPLGGGWPFAIPHPARPGEVLAQIEVTDAALSISSTMGPGTLAPERAPMIRPASGEIVVAAHCAIAIDRLGAQAEAMSTALIVADGAVMQRLLSDAPDRRYLFDFLDGLAIPAQAARM